MRNIKRISLAVLLVVVMLMQTVSAFAAVSPIVYEYGEDGTLVNEELYDANGNKVG